MHTNTADSHNNRHINKSDRCRVMPPHVEKIVGQASSFARFFIAGAIGGIAIIQSLSKLFGIDIDPFIWAALLGGGSVFAILAFHYHIDND